ncbi:MAG TPA: translation initiation factor eIF-2B [Candidatus Competibacter sp.]|nr:translation initiation factor eIF-2B [Candidatus Competibacter sp.]
MSLAEFNREITEIRTDRIRGASELARRCLSILAEAARALSVEDAAELRERLLDLSTQLAETRPSMAPVQNLLHRWQEASGIDTDTDLATARRVTADRANALIVASQRAMTDCAIHTARLLGADRTVMTHSLSSTVLEVFRLLKSDGLRAIITESRPLEEGRQLAERLSAWGVPATYITDAQMGLFIAQADAVLVGADSVLTDGAVVNKAGTYLLALAAKEREIPFYVCCESFKRCGTDASPPELEEMACAELGVPGWPGVTVRNVYFDITPTRLVSTWIDETGVHRPNAGQQKTRPLGTGTGPDATSSLSL